MSVYRAKIARVKKDGTVLYAVPKDSAHQGKNFRWVKSASKAFLFDCAHKAREIMKEIKHRHGGWHMELELLW